MYVQSMYMKYITNLILELARMHFNDISNENKLIWLIIIKWGGIN
jgi:hypothetical protein